MKFSSYILGFALSLAFTIAAFAFAAQGSFARPLMLAGLVLLALLQLFVQIFFFMHLREEHSPRFNLLALLLALFIVGVVVGGTLWIMNNLSGDHMSAEEVFKDEGILPPH